MTNDSPVAVLFETQEKHRLRQKRDLGARVQILRVLVQRYYSEKRNLYKESDYQKHCEAVMDNMLAKHKYNLEYLIDNFRKITPHLKEYPITCKECDHRPPFCGFEYGKKCTYSDELSDRERLWHIIKKMGVIYGDTLEELWEYYTDVYEKYKNDLSTAIECFADQLKQKELIEYGKASEAI